MSDLISRDALVDLMCKDCAVINKDYCRDHGSCPAYGYAMQTPVVDATLVTHGKWIHRKMDIAEHPWRCSVCSWGNHHIDRYVSEFERCPGCGAIMDADKTQI